MAASESGGIGRVVWPIVLVFFSILTVSWPFLDDEPNRKAAVPSFTVPSEMIDFSWHWKQDVSGTTNVIYGTVRNKGNQPLKQIVLEFRTQDKNRNTLNRHSFSITDLSAGQQKPFRADFRRSTQEDSGFVEITKIVPQK